MTKLKKILNKIISLKIEITSLLFFVIILSISSYILNSIFEDKFEEKQNLILKNLKSIKTKLEKGLYSRIYYTKGLAAYVSLNPDINPDEFKSLAEELIGEDTVISTMSLSKNGVIGMIYPLEGHEKAIGLDLFAHPARRKIVNLTIKTHKTFVAGPIELVEGGVGLISYTPIFTKTIGKYNFWGMCDIVIYSDKLFNEIDLIPEDLNYKYALKGEDGKGVNGKVFWGDSTVFNNNPITIDIVLPTGEWILGCTPVEGWNSFSDNKIKLRVLFFFIAIIFTILFWLLLKAVFKIRQNEKKFRALFQAMDQIIIELDYDGRYIDIAPTNDSLLYLQKEKLLNKKLHEIFDKETADFFLNAVRKCLKTKELTIIDYPLDINGKTHWFQARLTPLTNKSVLYIAQDNTEAILSQKALEESEKTLKELNETKDKFFTIIAHDLKGPLGAFLNLTELLHNDYDNMDEKEKKEIIEIMHKTSKSVYDLLENLLIWSKSQRGKISFEPSLNPITYVCDNIYSLYYPVAKEKNIELINKVKKSCLAYYDYNTVLTVVRNLVANAIKFTPEGGKIIIECAPSENNNNEVVISVKDSGVGIPKDKINDLFNMDTHFTTPGTNNEKGSGLGLILSKEFVEKNGGKIWVESTEGKGTTFYFTLPTKARNTDEV